MDVEGLVVAGASAGTALAVVLKILDLLVGFIRGTNQDRQAASAQAAKQQSEQRTLDLAEDDAVFKRALTIIDTREGWVKNLEAKVVGQDERLRQQDCKILNYEQQLGELRVQVASLTARCAMYEHILSNGPEWARKAMENAGLASDSAA